MLSPYVSVLGTGQLPEQTAELKPHRKCTLPLGWEEPKFVEILGSSNTGNSLSLPIPSARVMNDKVRTMQTNAVLLSISIPLPSRRWQYIDLGDCGSDNDSDSGWL